LAIQIKLEPEDRAVTNESGDGTLTFASDLAYIRLSIANVVFVGTPGAGDRNWVLVDTGLVTSRAAIEHAAQKRFGHDARPAAIVLTHGHFDHAGSVEALARSWDVPVFAHPLEHPYLDGSASYPPADPWVGGGLVAMLSPLFPRSPVNLGERLRALPANGSIPAMPVWRWIHTPGHTPGHVSLWRDHDRTIIAGDAFITTGQESAYEVAVQELEIHGPPRYFTPDWQAAHRSVENLADLSPDLAISGHGAPVVGEGLRTGLRRLADDFQSIAVPEGGRYVGHPATVADGSAYRRL